MAENILANYKHDIDYLSTALNAIGATTSITLRTLDTVSGDTAYVRKFGNDYLITDVTDIEDPVDVNMTFRVYALDGTLLGSRVGGGAFVAGSSLVVAQACYMEIEADGGNVVVLAGIDVDTDVDAGGITFVCAAETITDGDTLTLYLSDTASTYYDGNYMHGGGRHTPALGAIRSPYFDIATAYAALDSANDGVLVLDSATYDEEQTLSRATTFLQAALGQTPTITRGVGARVTREVEYQGDNTDTAYVSKDGNDADPGTYQEPYLTIQNAHDNLGARTYIKMMDSDIYAEVLIFTVAVSLEPLYGMMPTIQSPSSGTHLIDLQLAGQHIYGMTINGSLSRDNLINMDTGAVDYDAEIKDNTIYNANEMGIYINGVAYTDAQIVRNEIYNTNRCFKAYDATCQAPTSALIDSNYLYSSNRGIFIEENAAGVMIFDGTISNNVIYNHAGSGIYFDENNALQFGGTIESNTIYNNVFQGIQWTTSAFTGSVKDNIVWDNGTDLIRTGGAAATITESNYSSNSGWTIGAGNITTDPKFCKETTTIKLGISADSGAYRTDTNDDDMGAHLRIIEINESTIVINGFNIDGQEKYNNGVYIVDSADHTALSLKWCSIFDFQGIAVDLYDDDTNLDAVISNCEVYQNGNGIKLVYGGNTIEESLIYSNTIYGLHMDYIGQTLDHDVFFNNQYGLYIESNSTGISIKNSIFSGNSLYGIYSEISIVVTYCCITDATNNVDNSDESNFSNNPLFINTDIGSEDFHIKTIEGGYQKDSPCKDVADDGYDVGAYLFTRIIGEDDWKKYTFEFNPHIQWTNIQEGYSQFVDGVAGKDNFAKDSKRMFIFDFGKDQQVSSEEIRQKMEYFATLIKTRSNGLVDEQTKFRLHFQPTSYLVAKASAVITTADNNIFDSAKSWVENQWKGFHAGVLYDSGTLTGTIEPVGKTLTVAPDPSWTNDEWIGYYFYYNGYYYYILDNDSDSLTLSDPNETLTVQAGISWTIEKYFKIISNSENTLCVSDDDDELVDGTYTYYIDFIECKVFTSSFQYLQPRFLYTREHSKTGYKLIFQEV